MTENSRPVMRTVVFENLNQTALKQIKDEQVQAIRDQEARRIKIAYKEKHQRDIESKVKQ